MKKGHLPRVFPLIAGISAFLIAGGCSGRSTVRDCVDEFGNIRPDIECQRRTGAGGFVGTRRFIYGGVRSGNRVTGGSTTAPASGGISTRSGTTIRSGGFGGSGRSFSS